MPLHDHDHAQEVRFGLGKKRGGDWLSVALAKNSDGAAELALICACCSPVSTSRWEQQVLEAAVGVDWARVESMSRRHRVGGMVAKALRQVGLPIPPDVARQAQAIAFASLRQCAEAFRVRKAFAVAEIPLLFLKGVALEQRVYGSIGTRHSNDIDVVIPQDQVLTAWAVLAEAGYAQTRPSKPLASSVLAEFMRTTKDSSHFHAETRVMLELHWRISDHDPTLKLPHPNTWQEVQIRPGGSLTTLRDDALFIYLCAHGSAHAWARLKWLADIAAMLSASDDHGEHLWRTALAAGADRTVAAAIILSSEMFHTALPPGFTPPRSIRLRLLLALSRRMMAPRAGDPELATTRWRAWAEPMAAFLSARGSQARYQILRQLFVPGEDIALLSLPRGFGFLYPLMRAPLWFWKRSPLSRRRI